VSYFFGPPCIFKLSAELIDNKQAIGVFVSDMLYIEGL